MAEINRAETEINEVETTETKPVLIIEGVRGNGSKFRPSDWPERISSTFAMFGKDQRLRYLPGVSPRMFNGQKVLAVEPSLQWQNPTIFHAIMKFARENDLRTREEVDTVE